jgi:hypothetical protein
MTSLLGHGRTNGIPSSLCAYERGHAEQQRRDTGSEMQFFVQRSGEEKCNSGVAGHWTDGIARKQGVCIVQMRVSPDQFLTCSVTASGPMRRPAAGSLFCFDFTTPSRNNRVPGTPDFIALRVTVSIYDGPSVNAELRPWESRPLA